MEEELLDIATTASMKESGVKENSMAEELSPGLMAQDMKETMSTARNMGMALSPILQRRPTWENGGMEDKKVKALFQILSQTSSSRELGQMESTSKKNDSI